MRHFQMMNSQERVRVMTPMKWFFCLSMIFMSMPMLAQGTAFEKAARKAQEQQRQFVAGQVVDHATSLPMAGVGVALQSDFESVALTTRADGGFSGYISGSTVSLTVAHNGYVPVTRQAPENRIAWQPQDVRLVAREAQQVQPYNWQGVTLSHGSGLIGMPAVTFVDPQALPALMPAGYSPIVTFELQGVTGSASFTLQMNAVKSRYATAAGLVVLRQETTSWRVASSHAVDQDQIAISNAGAGIFAIAALDPGKSTPTADTLLDNTANVAAAAAQLANAVTEPAVISVLDEPETEFFLLAAANADIASGANARVLLQEFRESNLGRRVLPERALSLRLYRFGLRPRQVVSGRLPIRSGITEAEQIALLSARIRFDVTTASAIPYGFTRDDIYQSGPLTLDFSSVTSQTVAVSLNRQRRSVLPIGQGLESFDLTLAQSFSSNMGLVYQGGEAPAVILVQELDDQSYRYCGLFARQDEQWVLQTERAAFQTSGRYHIVALPWALTEITGTVSDQAAAAEGVIVSNVYHPYHGETATDGSYFFFVPQLNTVLTAINPQTLRNASLQLTLDDTITLLENQNMALEPVDFQLIDHEPHDGAQYLETLPEMRLSFNLPVTRDEAILSQAITLADANSQNYPVHVFVDGGQVRVLPKQTLLPETTYTLSVATSLVDIYGNLLVAPVSFSFSTKAVEEQQTVALDLTEFYLTEENDILYLNAPVGSFPDQLYLVVLNESTAFSDSYILDASSALKIAVEGVAGNRFELSATSKDGRTYYHRVDLVKLAANQYLMGQEPFTITVGDMVVRVDDTLAGAGTRMSFTPTTAAQVQAKVDETPALAGWPEHFQVLPGIDLENLDGGAIPKFQARVEIPLDTTMPEFSLMSMLLVEEMLLPTPESTVEEPILTARALDAKGVRTSELVTKRQSGKRFNFVLSTTLYTSDPTNPYSAGSWLGMIAPANALIGGTPFGHIEFSLWTYRAKSDNRNGNRIPIPKRLAQKLLGVTNHIEMAPNVTVWGNVSNAIGQNNSGAGTIPVGATDENGELRGAYYWGALVGLKGVDPINGDRHESFITNAKERNGGSFGLSTERYFTCDHQLEFLEPDVDSLNQEIKLSWVVGSMQQMDPEDPDNTKFVRNYQLTQDANKKNSVKVQGENFRLAADIQIRGESASLIQDVNIDGVGPFEEILYRGPNSITGFLPSGYLQSSRTLNLRFNVLVDGGLVSIERKLLIYQDIPEVDAPGPPYVLSAPEGTGVNLADPLTIAMSEPCQNWLGNLKLYRLDDNGYDWSPVDVSLSTDDGSPILNALATAQRVRIHFREPKGFDAHYRLDLSKDLTDLAGNPLFVQREPVLTHNAELFDGFRTYFSTQTIADPSEVLGDRDTRKSIAWYQNLMVVYERFSNGSEEDVTKGYSKVYVYDYRNPLEPKLVQEFQYKSPYWHKGAFPTRIVLFPPESLGPDHISLSPNKLNYHVDHIPNGTFLVVFGMRNGISLGAHLVGEQYGFDVVRLVDVPNPIKENPKRELKVIGDSYYPEAGLLTDFEAFGPYLVMSFSDAFTQQGATTVLDMRLAFEDLLRHEWIKVHFPELSTSRSLNEGLASFIAQNRYPHPVNVDEFETFFRVDENGVSKPTILLAGRDFPGIYPFEGHGIANIKGAPLGELSAVDDRYLMRTQWSSPTGLGRHEVATSLEQLRYFDNYQNAYSTDDFAIFSTVINESQSLISLYRLRDGAFSGNLTAPYLQISVGKEIRGLSADSQTGLLAMVHEANGTFNIDVIDLRYILEEASSSGADGLSFSLSDNHVSYLTDHSQVTHLGHDLKFYNGILYDTDLYNKAVVMPIAPIEFYDVTVNLKADSNNNGTIDETDDIYELYSTGYLLEYLEDDGGGDADVCEQQNKRRTNNYVRERTPETPIPGEIYLEIENDFNIEGKVTLDFESGFGGLELFEPGSDVALELPITWGFDEIPPLLEAKPLRAGEVYLKMRFDSELGERVHEDIIKVTATPFLQGPGLVNGDDFVEEYTYVIPFDPSGQELDQCRDVQRTLGFDLLHPATVNFTYGDEALVDNEVLQPGYYEYPIEIKDAQRKEWFFDLTYSGDRGTVQNWGYIEAIRQVKSRLSVGSTSVKGVNLNSGLLTLGAADVSLPGFGPSLEFSRHYVSSGDQDYNPLGPGWQHNWQTRLVYGDCNTLKVIGGDGSGMQYDVSTGQPVMRGVHSYLEPTEDGAFALVTRRGIRWVYGEPLAADSAGPFTPLVFKQNLLYVEDTFGNRVTVISDAEDHTQITRVVHDDGRELQFSYDTTGDYPLLTQVATLGVDPAIVVTYQHDSNNRMTTATRNGGYTEAYAYEDPCSPGLERNRIVSYTNANGYATTYDYDTDGLITAINEPEGLTTTFSYVLTEGEQTATVSDPLATTTYEFNFHGQPTKIVGPLGTKTMVWAENDVLLLSEVNEAGQTITYDYDGNGNMTSRSVAGAEETWTYDQTWNKPLTYTDANGNTTTYALDADTGATLSMTDAQGGETSYTYDDKGLLTDESDPNGNEVSTTYDGFGYPVTTDLADGTTITRTFDTRGRMLTESLLGSTTTMTYTSLDYILESSTTVVGGPDRVVSYGGYLPMGQPTSKTEGLIQTNYGYDGLNRPTSEVVDPGQGQPVVSRTYQYNAHGNVTSESISTVGGNRVFASTYDAAGRLLSKTLNGNSFATYAYLAGTTLVTSETDWRGASVSYTYDSLLYLATKTLETGHLETFAHDSVGNMLSLTDGDGRVTSYTYDGLNRAVSVNNPAGHDITLTRDENGNVLTLVNGTTGEGFSRTYDSRDRVVSETLYNSGGNQTTSFSYSNGGLSVIKTPPEDAAITETYNVLGDLVSRQQNGITTGYTYDANGGVFEINHPMGYTTTYVRDGFGRPTSATYPEGYTESWAYDGYNNAVSQTDARGVSMTSTYDEYNRPLTRSYASSLGNTSETWSYSQANGQVTISYTDLRGHQTDRLLDARGRILTLSDPIRGTVTNTYSAYNRTASVDFNNNSYSYTYDPLDRPLSKTGPGGAISISYNDGANSVTVNDRRGIDTVNHYDTMGNLLSVVRGGTTLESHAYDNQNRPTSSTDGSNITTTRSYDNLDRLTSEVTGPVSTTYSQYDDLGRPGSINDGRSTSTFTYDFYGRVLTSTNGEGETTTMTYDAVGNMLSRKAPGPLGEATWNYSYNLLNQVTEVRDPLNHVTSMSWSSNFTQLSLLDAAGETSTWSYDAAGRLTSMQRPGLGSIGYTYDGNDNPTTISLANSSASLTYDHDNLVLNETWTSMGGMESVAITRTRDANGNLTNVSQTSQGQTFSRSLTYDDLDRPTQISDSDNLAISIGYFGNGSRSHLTLPSGLRMDYDYDGANRLTSVDISGQGSVNYSYLANGLVSGINYANGMSASFDYDYAGRPVSADYLRTDGERTTFTATYYGDGSRQSLTEDRGALGTWQTDYQYDRASRLVGFTRSTPNHERTTSFTLDAVGNRLSEMVSQTGGGYTRDRTYSLTTGHRVTGFNETIIEGGNTKTRVATYSYDGNGNRTQKALTDDGITTTHDMQWDACNRMVGLNENGATKLTMHYDDLDRRVRKLGDSRGDIRYVWNDLAVLEEYQDLATDQAPLASYSYGLERLTMKTVAGDVYAYTYDMGGSVADLVANDNSLVQAQSYSPFGKIETILDTLQGGYNRLGFSGHEWDPESELTYAKARYYDQDLGTFTSQDPVLGDFGSPPSLHRYMYSYHNPTRFFDPDGRETKEKVADEKEEMSWWDKAKDFGSFALDYFESGQARDNLWAMTTGVGEVVKEATIDVAVETFNMAHDLGHAAFDVGKIALTGESHDFQMRSAIGKASMEGATTMDFAAAAVNGVIETPGRIYDAATSGDPKQMGRAAGETLGLILGGRGLVRGLTRGGVGNVGRSLSRRAGNAARVMKESATNVGLVAQKVGQQATQVLRKGAEATKAFARQSQTQMKALARQTKDVTTKAFNSTVAASNKAYKKVFNRAIKDCSCFVQGTMVLTVAGLMPIEALEVGDRVLTETTDQQIVEESIVDETWVKIEFWIPPQNPTEGSYTVIALRPSEWLTANDLGEGKWARVYIKEKTSFVGRIEKIEPAPAIEDGPGRVVTATLFNRGKEVIELHVASQPEPIEVTASHLLYSATRDRYVPAGDLLEGERLKTREGQVAIEQIVRLGAVAQVFDIEVEGDHHYYVSESGVLSHNCGGKLDNPKRRVQKEGDVTFNSERAARREAMRRYNAKVSEANNYKRVDNWDKNPNLRGPNGQPSEILETINLEGKAIKIDHHKWGHHFEDNNTYELPHYQGPSGEHISYPFSNKGK